MEMQFDTKLIFAILNGKVTTAIYRLLLKNFAAAGIALTPEGWTVLLHLADADGVNQQELCRATYREKPSMSRLIDNMERGGLLVRRPNPADGRSHLIYLTTTGRITKNRAQMVALRTLREALRGLSEEKLVTTQEVLRQIFENATRPASAAVAPSSAQRPPAV